MEYPPDEITVTFTMNEAVLRSFVESYVTDRPLNVWNIVANAMAPALPAQTLRIYFEDLAAEAIGKTVVGFKASENHEHHLVDEFTICSISVLQNGTRINVNSNPGGLGMGGTGATILPNGWIDVQD